MNAFGAYLRASKPNPARQEALKALFGQLREDAKLTPEKRAELLAKRQEIDRLYPEKDRATFDDFMAHMRSEEHTSEHPSLMRISYAVFCMKKTNQDTKETP